MTPLNPFLKLEVDLNKTTSNYRTLEQISGIEVTAVVKANAYGVGAIPITQALFKAGCRKFYVATIDEALELRDHLSKEAIIYLFNGFSETHLPLLFEKDITPILTTLDQLKLYKKHGGSSFFLHFDTGMGRVALPRDSMEEILKIIPAPKVSWVMSHLACADELDNPKNTAQLDIFKKIACYFPHAKKSFIASKGINLGPEYYFDQIRSGIYLYGVTPSPETPISKSLEFALTMQAQIIDVRSLEKGESVGYNATYTAESLRRIATLAVGYADGIPLSYSNKNHFWLKGIPVPIIGRISMDLTLIDITGIPESIGRVGEWVDLIRDPMSFYEMSKAAGSSPHEMLTRIGPRYNRIYKE